MGVEKSEMLIGKDFKKVQAKSLNISKKNLVFMVVAVLILEVADTVIIRMTGAHTNTSSNCIVFSAVIFGVLKYIYDKVIRKSAKKVSAKEESSTDEVQEEATVDDDCHQSATLVVDTMKVKPPPRAPRAPPSMPKKMPVIAKPRGCEATIWVSSRWRAPTLNPQAKKFEPQSPLWASTLDSKAAAFVPGKYAIKEQELLKSESGEAGTGDIVYRSHHWLNEIGSQGKKEQKKSKSSSPRDASKKPKRKWVPTGWTVSAGCWTLCAQAI